MARFRLTVRQTNEHVVTIHAVDRQQAFAMATGAEVPDVVLLVEDDFDPTKTESEVLKIEEEALN